MDVIGAGCAETMDTLGVKCIPPIHLGQLMHRGLGIPLIEENS